MTAAAFHHLTPDDRAAELRALAGHVHAGRLTPGEARAYAVGPTSNLACALAPGHAWDDYCAAVDLELRLEAGDADPREVCEDLCGAGLREAALEEQAVVVAWALFRLLNPPDARPCTRCKARPDLLWRAATVGDLCHVHHGRAWLGGAA